MKPIYRASGEPMRQVMTSLFPVFVRPVERARTLPDGSTEAAVSMGGPVAYCDNPENAEELARILNEAEWHDMESAPKDRRILIDWGGKIVVGYWLNNSLSPMPWQGWKFEGMHRMTGKPKRWKELPT